MGGMDARQWIVELVEAPATRKNARAVVVAAMKHNPHNQNKATGHAMRPTFRFAWFLLPLAARAVLRTHEGDVAKRASPHTFIAMGSSSEPVEVSDAAMGEGEPAEEPPSLEGMPQLSLEIFNLIKSSHAQHGLRHGDYVR